ncbi:MAG: hypothetical protein RL204_107 [Bacteroidota bacterium]|jgi:hypothetical protein
MVALKERESPLSKINFRQGALIFDGKSLTSELLRHMQQQQLP